MICRGVSGIIEIIQACSREPRFSRIAQILRHVQGQDRALGIRLHAFVSLTPAKTNLSSTIVYRSSQAGQFYGYIMQDAIESNPQKRLENTVVPSASRKQDVVRCQYGRVGLWGLQWCVLVCNQTGISFGRDVNNQQLCMMVSACLLVADDPRNTYWSKGGANQAFAPACCILSSFSSISSGAW